MTEGSACCLALRTNVTAHCSSGRSSRSSCVRQEGWGFVLGALAERFTRRLTERSIISGPNARAMGSISWKSGSNCRNVDSVKMPYSLCLDYFREWGSLFHECFTPLCGDLLMEILVPATETAR